MNRSATTRFRLGRILDQLRAIDRTDKKAAHAEADLLLISAVRILQDAAGYEILEPSIDKLIRAYHAVSKWR